jgi:hypothetical protein
MLMIGPGVLSLSEGTWLNAVEIVSLHLFEADAIQVRGGPKRLARVFARSQGGGIDKEGHFDTRFGDGRSRSAAAAGGQREDRTS